MLAEPGTEGTVKFVRIDFDLDTHRMLRLAAAYAGQSITGYVRKVVAGNIRNEMETKGTSCSREMRGVQHPRQVCPTEWWCIEVVDKHT